MKISFKYFIILVFFIGFIVRLYRFDYPIADWHSWRQSDTSAVSKIFVSEGFNFLYPKYFDISNIQTGQNNPQGYRFVEFPLYNLLQAASYKFIGIFTIEEWGRIITISSSLLTGFFLFQIAKKYFGELTGLFSLIFYLFLPFSIYYGRTILPDTSMIMASFGSIYFFEKYITGSKSKNLFLFISSIFALSALLLKPYAVFFLLPNLIMGYQKYKKSIFLRIDLWLYFIFSFLPIILWRIWLLNFPEGVPSSIWLLNGNGIRFRPAFFRWIIYERLVKLILGYTGIIIFLTGIFDLRKTRNSLLAFSFLLSAIIYVLVFATGNVQHDYYQILIIPSISLFCGIGAAYLYGKGFLGRIGLMVIISLSFFLSWNIVKDYFNINNESLVIAGIKADNILPKSAKVIAPYNGDTTLLYYINRRGWPAFQSSTEELISLGATHMVLVNPNENDLNGFGKKYKIIAYTDEYLILEL